MIKEVTKVLVELGEGIQEKLADGKIKFLEYVSLVVDVFPDAFHIIKNGAQLKEEWLDFTDEERAEVVDYLVDELNLENDTLEAKIEKGFEMLMAVDSFVREWVPGDEEE